MLKKIAGIILMLVAALALGSCSTTRLVPEGSYLLDHASISVADSCDVATKRLYNYLRQTPNHRVLGFAKLQLGIYNLSGRDTTRPDRAVGAPAAPGVDQRRLSRCQR